MSIEQKTVVVCDECEEVYEHPKFEATRDRYKLGLLVRHATDAGWIDNDDETHTCPKCHNLRTHLVAALSPVFGPEEGSEEWERRRESHRLDRIAELRRRDYELIPEPEEKQ